MLFEQVLGGIRKNKEVKESGGFVGVPFPFPTVAKEYPVLEKGHAIGILAGTGVGKSRFSRYVGIHHVYKFYRETGYKTKIFYFPLEDNKEKVYLNILCNYLFEQHDIYVTVQELQSKGDRVLPDFVLEKLDEAHEYFADFEKIVTILDGYSEPKKIFDVLEDYAKKTGKNTKYKVNIEGREEEQWIYESDVHTFVVLDNLANIERGSEHGSDREAMVDMARSYIRERLCNYFKFTVFVLLQNDFQTERQQFGSNGKTIMAKVEPSLASIGEAKTVARSLHIIFTLFDPHRYEFLRYPQVSEQNANRAYNIEVLGNRFRSLRIIKNNDGDVGKRIPLMMNGAVETFKELPPPDSEEIKAIYRNIKENKLKYVEVNNKPRVVIKDEDEDLPF